MISRGITGFYEKRGGGDGGGVAGALTSPTLLAPTAHSSLRASLAITLFDGGWRHHRGGTPIDEKRRRDNTSMSKTLLRH